MCVFIWAVVFTFPILLSTGGDTIDWVRTSNEIIRILPFFLVFILNNYFFFRLFKKKKIALYFLVVAISVLLISFLGSFSHLIIRFLHLPELNNSQSPIDAFFILNSVFYNLIFSILVIGLNTAIKINVSWFEHMKNYQELQKENLRNQLLLLKNQISPHFFMNTLNNIHALIDYDKEIAKNSVVKLSKLMRVLLYEVDNEFILLRNKKFVITLMRLKNLEMLLPREIILRVHRSYIVNIQNITTIEKNRIVFYENIYIPVSDQYKEGFKEFVNRNLI